MTGISGITEVMISGLEAVGFTAMTEYSAADSLLHKDEFIGFCGVKECSVADEAMKFDGETLFVELEAKIELRLMGKACNFSDGAELAQKCDQLFIALEKDDSIAVNSAKLCETSQSLPLRRLEKKLELDVRVCIQEAMDYEEA
ncbi:hypothetical protein [Ruminococcus sp.]|uniref:hypothetical protein n=1 Tax=Ruminococcus sp. TaxID=41978 RepID=UPI0025D631A1|nr:hypothetical protein [Ruminococcus sp.]